MNNAKPIVTDPTVPETAQKLGISESQVRAYIKDQTLAGYRELGDRGKWRVTSASIVDYLKRLNRNARAAEKSRERKQRETARPSKARAVKQGAAA